MKKVISYVETAIDEEQEVKHSELSKKIEKMFDNDNDRKKIQLACEC